MRYRSFFKSCSSFAFESVRLARSFSRPAAFRDAFLFSPPYSPLFAREGALWGRVG